MATDVVLLRRLVDEPTEDTYSDADLADRLTDAGESINTAALVLWKEKMIAASGFVDVSEGGSSRKMSQAYDHAKEMVAFFEREIANTTLAPKIRKLVRSTGA